MEESSILNQAQSANRKCEKVKLLRLAGRLSFLFAMWVFATALFDSPAIAQTSKLPFGGKVELVIDRINVALPSFAVTNLPIYIALDRGYYLEEKIEPRIILIGGPLGVAALLGGDVQFGAVGDTAVRARFQGAPLKVIATNLDRPLYWLYARPEIGSLDDLKGQPVVVRELGNASQIFFIKILKENFGWSNPEREIRWVPTREILQTLLSRGAIAGVLTTNEIVPANRNGLKMLLDIGRYVNIPVGGIVATETLMANKAELVQRFLRATLKGLWFLRKREKASIAILSKWMRIDEESAAKIFASARDFFTANGTVNEETMKQSLELNKRAVRTIAREQSLADVFEFGPIRLARQQLESTGWQP